MKKIITKHNIKTLTLELEKHADYLKNPKKTRSLSNKKLTAKTKNSSTNPVTSIIHPYNIKITISNK